MDNYINQRKSEGFYKKAKKDDVRARSYYKLEQIDKKYNLFKDGMLILDLGSAPGGWLQYIDRKIANGKIVGIDLLQIRRVKDFSSKVEIIEGDFNEEMNNLQFTFDIIVSDMAPEFSGDSKLDRGRTHRLNLNLLEFSKEKLRKGGNLVLKSFEGEDFYQVRKMAKNLFEVVKEFKPESSQKKSAELFLICFNKKEFSS